LEFGLNYIKKFSSAFIAELLYALFQALPPLPPFLHTAASMPSPSLLLLVVDRRYVIFFPPPPTPLFLSRWWKDSLVVARRHTAILSSAGPAPALSSLRRIFLAKRETLLALM